MYVAFDLRSSTSNLVSSLAIGNKNRVRTAASMGWLISMKSIEDQISNIQSLFRWWIIAIVAFRFVWRFGLYHFSTHLWWLYDYLAANKSHRTKCLCPDYTHPRRRIQTPLSCLPIFIYSHSLAARLCKFAFAVSRRLLSARHERYSTTTQVRWGQQTFRMI